MKDNKMNVLVIGSTKEERELLINSVVGTAIDENYNNIDVYESSDWLIRMIEAKGFDNNIFNKLKTFHQIKKFNKKDMKVITENEESTIDAIWLFLDENIEKSLTYLKLLLRKWKNVPLFGIIINNEEETDLNKIVDKLDKSKIINLKKVVVLKQEVFKNDKDVAVSLNGIDELCSSTIDSLDESRKISKENRDKAILNQKRYSAQGVVIASASLGAGIAFVDVTDIADTIALKAIEKYMVKAIFRVYGIYESKVVETFVKGDVLSVIGKMIASRGKGNKFDALVAGSIIMILGEAIVSVAEEHYTGKIKLDEFDKYVEDKIKNSPIIGKVMGFLNDNVDEFNKLDRKEISKKTKDFLKTVKFKK